MSAFVPLLLPAAATGYAGAATLEQVAGVCTHGGWKADADAGPRKSDGSSAAGPNCTYVGRRIAPSSTGTVVAVGCARNVASSLRTARSANRGLEALDSSAPNVAYVLFHDVPRGGDRDGTRDELLRMASRLGVVPPFVSLVAPHCPPTAVPRRVAAVCDNHTLPPPAPWR